MTITVQNHTNGSRTFTHTELSQAQVNRLVTAMSDMRIADHHMTVVVKD